ncbi:hypothetical protein [Klebsiella variicola]|uniref:hypothetical protein n=1 Tax=Klebsiella variicola TaxID=244366 RepID=UPI00298BDA0C|nr:hypothetical protein [Klebsiella variicola]
MAELVTVIANIYSLCDKSTQVVEDSYRLTVTGQKFTSDVVDNLTLIEREISALSLPVPSLILMNNISGADEYIDIEDAHIYINESNTQKWTIVFSKTHFAGLFENLREAEDKVIFFSENNLVKWIGNKDPFVQQSSFDPEFSKETTVWVYGLDKPYGGNLLWVVPVGWSGDLPHNNDFVYSLPSSEDVYGLLHISVNQYIQIKPNSFAITWGDIGSESARSFIRLSVMTLSCCLGYELNKINNEYHVVYKGTKRVSKVIDYPANEDFSKLQKLLIKAVSWIHQERPETRLQLIMDRLSLDIRPEDSIFTGLSSYLDSALQQSQDSYAFVILERKDAYHKEMRELLKDMRSQADLYASKVRDLVSNITRDILGVLAFVGFSFISKFDPSRLRSLLESSELSLLVKFLAGYLMLSCILQVIVHLRDARLSRLENENWLKVLQRYTSSQDNEENFLSPIKRRRRTLFFSIGVMVILYVTLAVVTWNIPCFVKWLIYSE